MNNRALLLTLTVLFISGSLFAGTYSGGSGTEGDPYQIATTADLIELSRTSIDWSKDFIQTTDILFNEDSSLVDWDGDGTVWDTDDEAGFTPIGNSTIKFSGSYNGQDHAIHNLFISRLSSSFGVGLFGYTNNATIKNVGITNASISGYYYVAALAGYNEYTEFDSCYSTGKINGYSYVGGLTGYNINYVIINNSFNECNVNSTESYAGGLSARGYGNCTISNCYNTGNINSNDRRVGGISGYLYSSTINNSYSTGNVSGTTYMGGLIGFLWVSNMDNCYSTGIVTGTSTIGGLNGSASGSTVTNSFWDIETSGMTTSAGAEVGKTTEEMKADTTFTNAGWDFVGESVNGNEGIWDINETINDGYPYLANLPDPETPCPITLASFTAKAKNGTVELAWSTASETDNARFLIYRNDEVVASVNGAGTSSKPHNYSIVDNTVIPGIAYTYVLADVSYANELVLHEDMAVTVTLANDIVEADYVIGAAYPNPFNPSAVLPFELTQASTVKASLYDLNGREVKSLVNGNFSAGSHELQINGANLTTGIYMVKVLINDMMNVQKIALVK